jgi:protein phosphatase-4 regulatory subunit 3
MTEESKDGWRVKVYQLNLEGQWDDKGTGHVQCATNAEGHALLVKAEDEGDTVLLDARIVQEDIYQKQGGSVCLEYF